MKRLKKSHILLIIFSVLILLGCVGVTVCLLFSNYQNVRLFKQAQNNFLRGDTASLNLAELQLQQLVRADDDNEAAYIMLGEIAALRKVYPEQVYFCYMAHRLNPFNEESKTRYIKSLCMARYFDRLENFLSQQPTLPDNWKPFLLYAAGRNGNLNKYKTLLASADNQDPINKLTALLFKENTLTAAQKLEVLNELPADDFGKQEFLAAQAELYIDSSDVNNAEKALKAALEINSYAFGPALGRFYANFRSLKQALQLFEGHLATYHDPVIALQTAEIYCLLKRTADIAKLRKHYQGDPGNRAMLICYYFDALNALCTNDFAALKELTSPLRKNINTPLALFMFFCSDLYEKNLPAIAESYTALISRRNYLDLQFRADDMLSSFLKRNLTELRGKEEQLLTLANLLYRRKKEAFTAKFILLVSRKQRAIDALLLKDALQRFKNDRGILKIAIEYFISNDPAMAEKLIVSFKKKFASHSADMLRYEIVLASQKKDFERVSGLFKKNFSPEILPAYWEFASSAVREDDLRFLSKDKTYEPFCTALLLFKKGDTNAACNILEKADAKNNLALLFFAAKKLAENGRNQAALKKYALFPDNSAYQLAVMLNTSELFAENGNLERALTLAAKAYQLAPDLPEVQLCYADKLRKNGDLTDIPNVVKLNKSTVYRKELEQLYISGMEARIKATDANSAPEILRNLCETLLRVDNYNKTAIDTLLKLREAVFSKRSAEQQKIYMTRD